MSALLALACLAFVVALVGVFVPEHDTMGDLLRLRSTRAFGAITPPRADTPTGET